MDFKPWALVSFTEVKAPNDLAPSKCGNCVCLETVTPLNILSESLSLNIFVVFFEFINSEFNFRALNHGRKIISYLISYQLRDNVKDLICTKIQGQSLRSGDTDTFGNVGISMDCSPAWAVGLVLGMFTC